MASGGIENGEVLSDQIQVIKFWQIGHYIQHL